MRHCAYYLKQMEECWTNYRFRASKTKLNSFKGNSDLADIYPRSDDENRGIDMRKVMDARNGRCHEERTSHKTMAYLFNLFGYLPYDYVATIHSNWQSGKSVGLGDIILIRKGIPVARDLCRNAATGFCAMCIGYIYPNGWGGHQPHEYKMNELILSFKDPFASDAAYTVVCHMQQNCLEAGPLGFRHAAAAVASMRPNRKINSRIPKWYRGFSPFVDTFEIYTGEDPANRCVFETFVSYADVVDHVVYILAKVYRGGSTFMPCYRMWMDADYSSLRQWEGFGDISDWGSTTYDDETCTEPDDLPWIERDVYGNARDLLLVQDTERVPGGVPEPTAPNDTLALQS